MEELNDYMLKFEKIKIIIDCFQKTKCPKCGGSLNECYNTTLEKTKYKCNGCNFIFYENQFYEVYFDEIVKVVNK